MLECLPLFALYRTYGKQESLGVQKRLFEDNPAVERDWQAYNARFKALSNWVSFAGEPFGDFLDSAGRERDSGERFALIKNWRNPQNYALHRAWRDRRKGRQGYADSRHPFQHQGGADLNTYKLFLEQAYAVLRPGGQLGVIVPSGIYTDKGTTDLRSLFLTQSRWRWLFGFENRDKIFDIDGRFKFCPIIVEKGGETQSIQTAFMRRNVQDWADAEHYSVAYARTDLQRFSPNTQSVLEIRHPRDFAVLEQIYKSAVLLGAKTPGAWDVKYATEFHMANDSALFPPVPTWKADGFRPDEYGRWIKGGEAIPHEMPPAGWIRLADGTGSVQEDDIEEIALPLYEGRMIGQFDFSQKGWVSGKGRTAVWRDIPFTDQVIEPQYLMDRKTYRAEGGPRQGYKVVMMDVTSATNSRAAIATVLGEFPCGHKTPMLTPENYSLENVLAVTATLNSFAFDFLIRIRLGGQSLIWSVLAETAVSKPLMSSHSIVNFCARLALTDVGFAPAWVELGRALQDKNHSLPA